jgi:hypothetical protein
LNRSDFFLKLGKFKTPFGREWMVFPGNGEFVDRSAATQAFTFGREMGAALGVDSQKFAFTAGVFNNGSDTALGVGYDPAAASASTATSPLRASGRRHGFLSVVRMVAMPFGPAGYSEGDVENSEGSRLDIGAGAALDRGRDADFNWDKILDDNDVSVLAAGSDVTWKRSGKSFQGQAVDSFIVSVRPVIVPEGKTFAPEATKAISEMSKDPAVGRTIVLGLFLPSSVKARAKREAYSPSENVLLSAHRGFFQSPLLAKWAADRAVEWWAGRDDKRRN